MKPKQNSKDNIDLDGLSWTVREFAYPDRTVKLGTLFSGGHREGSRWLFLDIIKNKTQ